MYRSISCFNYTTQTYFQCFRNVYTVILIYLYSSRIKQRHKNGSLPYEGGRERPQEAVLLWRHSSRPRGPMGGGT